MKGICVLGSTGSIGVSTIDVVMKHPDKFKIVALTANNNVDRLFEQCLRVTPKVVVLPDEEKSSALRDRLKSLQPGLVPSIDVLSGTQGLTDAVLHPEVTSVMAAIVGAAGLLPTMAAAKAGRQVLLANKEALVMSGPLFMEAVRNSGSELLPIDSEHNAIFQCMPASYRTGHRPSGIRKIILTASGGPFLRKPINELSAVTPAEAIAHPNWVMGRKISVDSATMMNKGLEVIEARYLFDCDPSEIDVVIHRQSVIHSMVDYVDGSVLAQLGSPDMRIPIAHALGMPDRIDSSAAPLNLLKIRELTFEEPDESRFPCLRLAYTAVKSGDSAPAVLNASNEVAVAAFLSERIQFIRIPEVIEHTLNTCPHRSLGTIDDVLDVDQLARVTANAYISQHLG